MMPACRQKLEKLHGQSAFGRRNKDGHKMPLRVVSGGSRQEGKKGMSRLFSPELQRHAMQCSLLYHACHSTCAHLSLPPLQVKVVGEDGSPIVGVEVRLLAWHEAGGCGSAWLPLCPWVG